MEVFRTKNVRNKKTLEAFKLDTSKDIHNIKLEQYYIRILLRINIIN